MHDILWQGSEFCPRLQRWKEMKSSLLSNTAIYLCQVLCGSCSIVDIALRLVLRGRQISPKYHWETHWAKTKSEGFMRVGSGSEYGCSHEVDLHAQSELAAQKKQAKAIFSLPATRLSRLFVSKNMYKSDFLLSLLKPSCVNKTAVFFT